MWDLRESLQCLQMYTDFQRMLDRMVSVEYDLLDIEVKQFDEDFYEFRSEVKQLERRLASVLNQVISRRSRGISP